MSFKCEMCDSVLRDKLSLQAMAWDWFTGYLEETHHYCPKHKHSREHDDTLILSQLIPVGRKGTPETGRESGKETR